MSLFTSYNHLTTRHGAPYVPLPPKVVEVVFDLAQLKPGERFFELGSGDGRLVIQAALRGAIATGIEIDPFRAWYSRLWIFLFGLSHLAHIKRENFFTTDLSSADVVFLYLLQDTNDRLLPKLLRELRPGTRIISAAFTFPGLTPAKIHPRGPIYGPLYLYIR